MKTIIIPTLRAEHIIKDLALPNDYRVVLPLGNKEGQKFFPDGEVYVRIPDEVMSFKGRIVVLHSGMPEPNKSLIELEMILDILSKTKSRVEVFFTYFSYGMQDKKEFKGEVNMVESLLHRFCNIYKVKQVYVLDAHFWGKSFVKKFPIKNITCLTMLKQEAIKKFGDMVFVAPDLGSQIRTKTEGAIKKRKNSFDVNFEHDHTLKDKVKNKVVGVVDDLVETGGTLSKFADVLRSLGAKKVVALVSHGVLVSGIKRVKTSYDELFLTNSIERDDSNVDIKGVILEVLIKNK